VQLNLDAGELPDETEELWGLFDVLAIACGGHAGDEASMERVVAFCARAGTPRIGAHPSYPDREYFGRRSIAIDPADLTAAIAEQCGALARVAARHGVTVEYVKPHGALYHDAARTPVLAEAIVVAAIASLGDRVTVIGPPRGALRDAALARGLPYAREGFADRGLAPDGSLVPRGQPGALITDPAAAARQARALAASVDTICMHGDTPGALAIARAVREAVHG
jgi:UPF0271 protein